MKPKTKTEKEVVHLSNGLPPLANRYKKRIETLIDYNNAIRFRGHQTDIIHFIVATTKGEWQVLRHFYLYATFKYKKLFETQYLECMQQWFNNGKYVYMALNRQQGYCNDAWCSGQKMSIKHDYHHCFTLDDPRNIGYTKTIYAKVQDRFKYLPSDDESDLRVDRMFRAVNTSPFWETVIKNSPSKFKWFEKHGFTETDRKTAAARIVLRHKYNYESPEWVDLIYMLQYLGKDLHNPVYVCPKDLKGMHDKMMKLVDAKRKKEAERLAKIKQISEERKALKQLEREKAAIKKYKSARKKFFGLNIAGQGIKIVVLQSVDEFMEEGVAMSHCVFSNKYYDTTKHPNSLIMSARKDGERVETIEVDLSDYKIIQSRGKHNSVTPYHNTIVDLVNANMDEIKRLNGSKLCVG